MKNDITQTIALSTRRLIAFFIDFLILSFSLLVIEILVAALLAHFSDYETQVSRNHFIRIYNSSHFLVIPLLLGIYNSAICNGQSAGSRLMRLITISHVTPWLSVVGCILRSFLLFGPAYLYFSIFFLPYVSDKSASDLHIPFLELSILTWLLLLLPISVIIGRGQQGFHDMILDIRVQALQHHPHLNGRFKHTSFSIMAILIIPIICSGLIAQFIENSDLVRKNRSLVSAFAANYLNRREISRVASVYDELKSKLKHQKFSDLNVSFIVEITPVHLEDVNISIPAYTRIAIISAVTHESGFEKLRKLTLASGEAIQFANLQSEYFKVSLARDVHFGFAGYRLSSECIYQKGIEQPLDCKSGIGAGPAL